MTREERTCNIQKKNRIGRILYPGVYTEGSGKVKTPPPMGLKLFFYLVGTYFFKLIALNFLTLLFCLPVLTIPASLTALSRVTMKLARQGYCLIYEEYFSELKTALFRYLPFFLISGLPAAAGVCLVYMKSTELSSGLWGMLLIGLSAIVFIFVYLLWCYAFPLFATVDLPVNKNIRNALYFIAACPGNSVRLVLSLAIILFFVLLLPYSLPVFVLFLPTFTVLYSCCVIKPSIEKHVIEPFLAQEKKYALHDRDSDFQHFIDKEMSNNETPSQSSLL